MAVVGPEMFAGALPGPAAAAPARRDPPPPRLRRDLDVHPADPDPDGTPAWLLHDPVTNRYFRIGPEAVDMLALVDGRTAESLAREASRRFGHAVETADAEQLQTFLRRNHLVEGDELQLQQFREVRSARPSLMARAAKGYIFFRVPLVRPDRFLRASLPYVAWLGSRPALFGFLAIGLIGLYLALRQLDVFLATLVQFLSLEGLVQYALVIVLVKACHELGHAYVATAKGLRVPTIGVAFIVFWPIAYTDTTDAWKLTRRRDKLSVGAAGVGVELGIAALSLFLWNVVPDGPLRGLLFLLATSTWAISLMVNLNPLMRFDGYFLFSDLVRMPNLEARGHAMGRWHLRRLLFGLADPRPEPGRGWLVAYAYAIWTYRLFLFLGIALAVYFLFFKALGIVLFLVEIVYFIGAPIFREARKWVDRFPEFRTNFAFLRTLAVLGALGLLLAVPWRGSIEAPAYVGAEYRTIYAPEAARLVALRVTEGQEVAVGEPLAVFVAPDLEQELEQALRRRDALLWERQALGVDSLRRERALVTRAELASQQRLIQTLEQRLARLTVRAELPGRIVDVIPDLREGEWVASGEPLFAVRGAADSQRVVAYVDEAEVARLEPGSHARFIAEPGLWPALDLEVIEIAPGGLERVEKDLVTSSYGGGVEVRVDADGEAIPLRATYKVVLAPPAHSAVPMLPNELRGAVAIEAEPQSLLRGMWIRAMALLRRESGL